MTEPWYQRLNREPLERSFLVRSTVDVAHGLVGCLLAVNDPLGILVARIVETEAYTGTEDAASHAAKRRNGLVEAMWGEPGRAYVYTSYGLHSMLNIVAKEVGQTGAVLVRAVALVSGGDVVAARRPGAALHRVAAGPGLVCRSLGISSRDHGAELVGGPRFALLHGEGYPNVHVGVRVGIRQATELPYRYFDADSKAVSAHRRGVRVSNVPGS